MELTQLTQGFSDIGESVRKNELHASSLRRIQFRSDVLVCADNPILVLAIFSWIIGGLAFGIQYLVIVTDPEELWASPTSETRIEKDYFDSRFQPFYRTNQIFIKPNKTENVCGRTIGIFHYDSVGEIVFDFASFRSHTK